MFKIRNIRFINHPILKNLYLDFCDANGNALDTILLAGENGVGKSIILNELYEVSSHTVRTEKIVEIESDGQRRHLEYRLRDRLNSKVIYVTDEDTINDYIDAQKLKEKLPINGIFSDVDINFRSNVISNVTSLMTDSSKGSRRSEINLPIQIEQLLIDVQALDDADIALMVKQHPDRAYQDLQIEERMSRFKNAFSFMFGSLTYSRIATQKGHKIILFEKNGQEIPISLLSSGEKQIVYRGCFLLRDINALIGAFVFLDEPEISLHPTWQTKIMDYYKRMFTDKNGKQTSQIFAVTHSPFVIHNKFRYNDKVIVLSRNQENEIEVINKPEYYECTSVTAVQDAFHIEIFRQDTPTVYLEGRTDEKYFNRALKVYGYHLLFQFKWIGHLNENGQEEFTGKDALDKAVGFLTGKKLPHKMVFLYDCDTHKQDKRDGNLIVHSMKYYDNNVFKKGIENALVLQSDMNLQSFYNTTEKEGDYGEKHQNQSFLKMQFCEFICNIDDDSARKIFVNLKDVIDTLKQCFEESSEDHSNFQS